MKQYLELLNAVLNTGESRADRTGVGTRSLFGLQTRYDLSQGFPLLTTKEMHFKSVVYELLWFIQGDTNIRYLNQHQVFIWDEWADDKGELGPIYGRQWRSWQKTSDDVSGNVSIDQLRNVIDEIQANPTSRRLIVSAWNVGELDKMRLPPCHILFQFYVNHDKLSCQLYQRSADIFLGVPFNIASYALLTMMVAQVCGLGYGELIHTFGDVHLYENHIQQAEIQLARTVKLLPRLELNPKIKDLFAFTYTDINLYDYKAHPRITAAVAV